METKRKIEILERVKEKLLSGDAEGFGLCSLIQLECFNEERIRDIELFTFNNAILYGNADKDADKGWFWWGIYMYDFENRIMFVNWMLDE